MTRGRELLTKAARKLDLPADIAAGLPHLELCGFCECSMDCHTGILEYETHEIVVALNIGTVTIQGSGLEMRLMQRDRLRVTGSIERLVFSGGKRGCGD